jgi:hypothetical protein
MLNDLIRMMREMAIFEAQAKVRYHEKHHRDNYIRHSYCNTQQKRIQQIYNNTKHK